MIAELNYVSSQFVTLLIGRCVAGSLYLKNFRLRCSYPWQR